MVDLRLLVGGWPRGAGGVGQAPRPGQERPRQRNVAVDDRLPVGAQRRQLREELVLLVGEVATQPLGERVRVAERVLAGGGDAALG